VTAVAAAIGGDESPTSPSVTAGSCTLLASFDDAEDAVHRIPPDPGSFRTEHVRRYHRERR
jgi:hypothetical protein